MTELYIDSKVHRLRELHSQILEIDRNTISIKEVLERQAQNILEAHLIGNDAVTFHLASWSPQFIGMQTREIMSSTLTLEQAKQTIAREYGYSEWASVQSLGNRKYDVNFERAIDYVITGQIESLSKLVGSFPQLIKQTSQHPHSATLLHYLAANGVESHRQITPLNAVDVASYLIGAGSVVNATANVYGGENTTLALLLTSAHPTNAGVVDELSNVLRKAGAA